MKLNYECHANKKIYTLNLIRESASFLSLPQMKNDPSAKQQTRWNEKQSAAAQKEQMM